MWYLKLNNIWLGKIEVLQDLLTIKRFLMGLISNPIEYSISWSVSNTIQRVINRQLSQY